MKALKFNEAGSLEHLKIVDVADPVAKAGEVIVKVHAAAINPSDVKNVLGKMHETSPPRIPGRDFAGVVMSESKWKGKAVFGTGGSLGFSKDGTHAEFFAVPESALVELPKNVSFAQATAMGLSYLTAWQSIVVAGKLASKETVLITGAAGAVGGAAVRIAHYLGAKVIGTRLGADQKNTSDTTQWIDLEHEKLPEAVNQLTQGRGVDLVFDVVGGPIFESCLGCLAQHGRQVAISSVGSPVVSFNLIDFYHKQAQLIGVDTLKLSFEECASILHALAPGMADGSFIPQEIDEISLADALEAYNEINSGKAKRKKVIVFSV